MAHSAVVAVNNEELGVGRVAQADGQRGFGPSGGVSPGQSAGQPEHRSEGVDPSHDPEVVPGSARLEQRICRLILRHHLGGALQSAPRRFEGFDHGPSRSNPGGQLADTGQAVRSAEDEAVGPAFDAPSGMRPDP